MIQEIVAIIDRSGSMFGKEEDTIGGINTMITDIKSTKEDTKINFSLKFFNDSEEMKYRSINIDEVNLLTKSDLVAMGQTALLDAIGKTLMYLINKKIKNNSCYNKCIVYVATDGLENCSKIYNKENIKQMINQAKLCCIEVLYLGANQDAILEASTFGIDCNNAINYNETAENISNVYRSLASAAMRQRTGVDISFTQAERTMSVLPDTNTLISTPPPTPPSQLLSSPPRIRRNNTPI